MSRLLAAACLVVTASGCAISSGPTTVSDLFGLECRTDLLESVVNDYGAVTGRSSVEEALAEFFESEGRRFTGLESLEPAADDLERAFVDSAGLIQLRVQLTDEYGGYLVAGYSYCAG
jgi:hypothetical protein